MNVYILSNPAMPGMVKIGRSVAVEVRVQSLSQHSGIPLPFRIEHIETPDDEIEVELIAHRLLAGKRVNPSREFFYADPAEAIQTVQVAALMAAWNKAGKEAREEFLSRIDTPIMDRRFA